MSLGKQVTLSSGLPIPQLGFGTWQSAPGQVGEAVYQALKAGYRHLDLATIYQNQKEVADGIKRAYKDVAGLKREDLFITSKLWNSQHHPDVVEKALDECLAELELDYLDLYLVHWPVAFKTGSELFPLVAGSSVEGGDCDIEDNISIVDTWKAMTKLPKSKARTIGVSNHMVPHLEAIINGSGVVPAVNQIERHPVLQSNELIDYCAKKNIHITAYSAFGNNMIGEPLLITHPAVKAVAETASKRLGKEVSPAQVILAWSQVGGHSVIPKSVTASRIAANFQEIELTAEEIAQVSALGQNRRRYNIPYVANKPRWNIDCFGIPCQPKKIPRQAFRLQLMSNLEPVIVGLAPGLLTAKNREWDPNSSLSKQEQHRALLDKWIRMGRFKRYPYFDDPPPPEEIPAHVPRDLIPYSDRANNGQKSSTLWIRTWYGDPSDPASQTAADTAYKKLILYVMKEGDPDYEYDWLDTEFLFDNKDEMDDPDSPDIVDGNALGTPGSVPSYLFRALLRCPDQFDGITAVHLRPKLEGEYYEHLDEHQCLLVMVADRKACEEGWVLYLAVNHKGRVLPFRFRDPATWANQYEANWLDGQALDENTDDPMREEEGCLHPGDGWAQN
ncbi:hypothetical protein FE257_011741 [Aspergillus nanangensis]|uniref:D-xylose reductase [NAD(P)H] n=1 Tax=Aspergillus nanangensis TaxID=2582783 RepID=A0AAD4CV59_ASPNN|nr:hypothetical protein FE257_011741 [Aspergillus nanangensis]